MDGFISTCRALVLAKFAENLSNKDNVGANLRWLNTRKRALACWTRTKIAKAQLRATDATQIKRVTQIGGQRH